MSSSMRIPRPFARRDRTSPDPHLTAPTVSRPRDDSWLSARKISIIVGAFFYVASLVIFRDVLMAIPSVLRGDAVIAGDELVPFFNWRSQLLDQAAGLFNELFGIVILC